MNEKDKTLSSSRRIKLSIISLVAGILIFITAYTGMKQQIGLGKLNQPLLSWMVGHRYGFVTEVAKTITSIANPLTFALIVGLIVVVWAGLKREIWRPAVLAGSIAGAAGTSTLLKTIFMNARPPEIYMIPAFEYDFSFPSGHTICVATFVLVLGYLIYSHKPSIGKLWMWIVATTIGTGLIGFSRLYLGYHWLTDVVASVGLALIILAIVIVVDMLFVKRFKD